MTKIEERITERIKEGGVLFEFLGAENVERLKREITDAIIQQVTKELADSYDYIIDPESIVQEIYDDVMENVKAAIRPKIEKALYEQTMAKLGLEA